MAPRKPIPACALWALVLVFPALSARADGPVGIDGIIGSDWGGITPSLVAYDPSAPLGYANPPGPSNHNVGYEIFMRRRGFWTYVGLRTTGPTDSKGLIFSNLSFTRLHGLTGEANIGFEVTNNRAFSIGAGPTTYAPDIPADLIRFATFSGTSAQADVIEVAFHDSIFLANALGVNNFAPPVGELPWGLRLYRSQSFGYSVAGGPTFGPTGLGQVAFAPEPGTLSLLALSGGAGALLLRRRRAR